MATSLRGVNDTIVHLRSTSESPVVDAELPGAQHDVDLVHSIRFEAVVDAVEVSLGVGP